MLGFKDYSITNKLRFTILIISGLSLILACGILGVIEVINFKNTQANELSILSNIIADRCTASLAFDDSKVSIETLETLKAKQSVISAYIFTQDGQLFARYRRADFTSDALPDTNFTGHYRFTRDSLLAYSPIILNNKKIGSVYIKSDLRQMYALIERYLTYVLLVLFGAILVVFFLLSRFQRFISKPILDLANTAGEIAVNMDFSTKVPKEGNDEIGMLVDAFNAMLDQLKQRDLALIESKNKAETSAQKARELARETYRVNLSLQKEISERKRAFHSMLESEKKYRGIFENAQEGIFRLTPDNHFLDVNPSMARIFGYSTPEELVESVSDIRQFFENNRDQERLYSLLESREAVTNFECRLKRKNNTFIWGSIQAITFRDQKNKLMYIEGLIEDITDRRLAEDALKDAYRELEKRVEERTAELRQTNEELRKAKESADEASEAKSIFLANMSHEIRTPMNGVISAAELALSEDMPPKIRHYLKIIHSSGNALLGIINDILDFSKIDAGKLLLENHPFRIDDVLNNVIAIFAHTTAEKNIELLIDIDPGTPYAVIGDPLRLQQILTNLMSNSVKFTESGGIIIIKINILKKKPDSLVMNFLVKDTGVGMTSRQLEVLFQAFSQGDTSTTRKFGGTGLGLCISKQLVELMGGDIDVTSEYGKGSEFTFTVQLGLQPEHMQEEIVLPQDLKNLRILIVDDCAESRHILSSIVKSFGCHSITEASGETAIERLKNQGQTSADLALIDFKMPGIHGLDTAIKIRTDLNLELPIVLMIDFVDKAILPEEAHLAVTRFLTKPIMASSVYNTILEVFGKKEVIDEKPKTYMLEAMNGYRKALGGLKVLIVEDNPINQEITLEIFKTIGVDAKIAEDGAKAVEAIQNEPFDAVLMDIQMPNMDGYEATRKIREKDQFKNLPIIAMTASALPSDEKKCFEAGMNAFVTKPIQLKKLFQTLFDNIQVKNRQQVFDVDEKGDSNSASTHIQKPPLDLSAYSSDELNIEQAMQNLKIDEGVYQKIIDVFLNRNTGTITRLKKHADLKNLKEIQGIAHSLVGSSANIGAIKIQTAAKNIENYCQTFTKEGGNNNRLRILIDELNEHLTETLVLIKTILKTNPSPGYMDEADQVPDLVNAKVDLHELLNALKESNPVKITTSLNNLKKSTNAAWVSTIEAKILDYEYDEAIKTLTHMAADMGFSIT